MDKLSKDVLIILALEMDIPSLLNFCSTNKRFDSLICKNDTFWRNRIDKERPLFFPIFLENIRRLDFPSSLKNILPPINYKKYYKKLQGNKVYEITLKNGITYMLKGDFEEDDFVEIKDFSEIGSFESEKRLGLKNWMLSSSVPEYTLSPFIFATEEEALTFAKKEIKFYVLEKSKIERYYDELVRTESVTIDEEDAEFTLHIEEVEILKDDEFCKMKFIKVDIKNKIK